MSDPIKLSSPETREFWEIPVQYEDGDLLALDKPAGLLTTPDPLEPARPCLMQLLHAGIAAGKPWATKRGLGYLMNAYRLESEATGLVLFAKSKPVLNTLANQFGSEKPFLHYTALVQGRPPTNEFEVDAPLAPHPTRPGLLRVDPKQGKRSRTRVVVVEHFQKWSLVRCEPLTLRIDQVRAHMRYEGCPLAGDALYGGRPIRLSALKRDYWLKPNRTERPLINRPAFHAGQLAFEHPVSRVPLKLTAPLPKDLAVTLKYLRRFV